MEIHPITVGPFAMNCYLVVCPATREAVLVDPGDEADEILRAVTEKRAQVRHILLTHAHLDHIGAVATVKQQTGADIRLHPEDLHLYLHLPDQGRMFGFFYVPPPPIDQFFQTGDTVCFGRQQLSVIHTPGHTPGGVCFYSPDVLLAGDTLFSGSIGRTDLPGGSYPTLMRSLRTQLLSLPDESRVFPGHGPATTIGAERRGNPFLQPGYSLA